MTDTKTNEPLPVGGGCAECGAKEGWPHSETCYELLRKLRESAQPAPPIIASFQTIIGTLEPIREGNWRVSKAITLLRIMQEEATQPDTAGGDVLDVAALDKAAEKLLKLRFPEPTTFNEAHVVAKCVIYTYMDALSPKPAPDKGSADEVERVTQVIKKAFQSQFDGHPIPGDAAVDSWTARGDVGCIDFEVLAEDVIAALRDNPGEANALDTDCDGNELQGCELCPAKMPVEQMTGTEDGYMCPGCLKAGHEALRAQPKPQGGEG